MKLTFVSLISLLAVGAIAFSLTVSADRDRSHATAVDRHIEQQATSWGGAEARKLRQFGEADLDRDGKPEIAVLYGLSCGNDTVMFLAVFDKMYMGSWQLVNQVYLGGRGLRHIDEFVVEPEAIRIHAREFQGAEPMCAPSREVVITVTVTHGLLQISRVEAQGSAKTWIE